MEHTSGDLPPHDYGSMADGRWPCPPRLTASPPAKPRRRAFVAQPPRTTAPPPSRTTVLPPSRTTTHLPHGGGLPRPRGGVLPRRQETPTRPPPGDVLPACQDWRPPGVGGGLLSRQETLSSVPPPSGLPSRQEQPSYEASFNTAAIWDATDNLSPTPTPDPRASSSQSFMNLMTQDGDADLELLMQQDPTPSSVVKGPSKRGSNYTHDEDIQLCISWMNISNDPIVANEQPGKTYWERIAQDFHKNKEGRFESERTPNSLEHRCGVIIKECMTFQGYYEEVERRHPI